MGLSLAITVEVSLFRFLTSARKKESSHGNCGKSVRSEVAGTRIAGDWIVVERIDRPRKNTGGCFSVGYKVWHENGREAFLKVSDLDLLTEQAGSIFERLKVAVETQTFERRILDYCRGNNMDRIVLAIDYGDKMIVHDGI